MLCPTSNSNYVAPRAINRGPKTPDRNSSPGEIHFTPIRDLFLAGVLICLMLNFVSRLFTQVNQLSTFKSGVSGLIDILTSDDPQPPKPMVPLPPQFAYIKGLGEASPRQIQSALSAPHIATAPTIPSATVTEAAVVVDPTLEELPAQLEEESTMVLKEIDPNRPLYGVGPDVTDLEPTLAVAPDLTGTGIIGAVPVAHDIANLSFVMGGIATTEKHSAAPDSSAALVSLCPETN